MTLVGKKLQDIYDLGAKRLTELQEQATDNFERVGEEHAQSMKQLAEKSSFSLQDKSSNLQSELKKLMQASLQRLEQALLAENEQNQQFVISLIEELQTRIEQMKSKLAALGQSHQENVDFAFNVACQNYLSKLETVKISLDENSARCAVGLFEYGTTLTDKMLQTTEQTFWQQQEQSLELGGSFFTSARAQEGAVANHASALAQTLTSDCQNRQAIARTLANKAAEEIETSIRSLLDTITSHADSIENESNEKYAQLTEKHFQKVDTRLSNFADELSHLHDGITDQLLKETEELSADLLSASTQTQDGLRTKCNQAVGSVNSDLANFKQRLDARLQLSKGQKQTLEDDKNKILIAIKNELLSIYNSFGKKVAALLDDSKSELTGMTKSVEAKILTALETCNEQVGNSATSTQKQIEDEVTAFLHALSDSRRAAVEEICSSASGTLPLVNAPQNVENLADEAEKEINSFELGATVSAENKPAKRDASDSNTPRRVRRQKGEDIAEK